MKKKLFVLFILLLAGAGVWAYKNVNRRPDNRIVVSGNIELTEVNISFKTAGRLIERSVDEGDSVKKGQVVARLDRDQLLAQRASQSAALDSAEAQLREAMTAVDWQRATLSGDIEQRSADVAANEARLSELKNGSRPQEKSDAQAAVDAAQAEVARSGRDWDRAQKLYKDDDISTAQFDQFRNRFETASATLKSAKERLALVELGPRVEQVNAQNANVERARGALKMAQA